MVIRLGAGSAALSNANTAVFLEEHAISDGALVRTIDVSTLAGSAGFGMSGTATSEGALSRAGNGLSVLLAGYQAPLGTASIAASSVPRCVARVDGAGAVSATTIITDAFSGNNARGAATNDGTGYWFVGGSGAGIDAGVRYVVHNSTGATTPVYVDITNNRASLVAQGQLFASTAGATGVPDGGSRIFGLGALPMSSASYVNLPGVDVLAPNSFALLDLNVGVAGLDTLYTSDTTGSGNGGVRKYTFDGNVWTQAWRANTAEDAGAATCSHVAAERVGADVVVLCTRGDSARNLVVKYVDVGGASATAPAGFGLFAAPTNTVYRGVAFSPQ